MIIYKAKIAFYTRMNGKKVKLLSGQIRLGECVCGVGGERKTEIFIQLT